MNKVVLIGRLVAEPQLRYTQSGVAATNFTLAVDRDYVGRSGEKETDFIDIVTWRKQAEVCANHLHKGRLVAVEGRLQIRSYDDQNNIRRKAAEVNADRVQFLDKAKDSDSGNADSPPEPKFDDVPF